MFTVRIKQVLNIKNKCALNVTSYVWKERKKKTKKYISRYIVYDTKVAVLLYYK